jgi:hypothetical protein
LSVPVNSKQPLDSIRSAITTKAALTACNQHVLKRFLGEKLEQNIDIFKRESPYMPGSLVFAKLKRVGIKPVAIIAPTVWHEPSVQLAYRGLVLERGLEYCSFLASDVQKVVCLSDVAVPALKQAPQLHGMAEVLYDSLRMTKTKMTKSKLEVALKEVDLGGLSLASWADSNLMAAPTFDFEVRLEVAGLLLS